MTYVFLQPFYALSAVRSGGRTLGGSALIWERLPVRRDHVVLATLVSVGGWAASVGAVCAMALWPVAPPAFTSVDLGAALVVILLMSVACATHTSGMALGSRPEMLAHLLLLAALLPQVAGSAWAARPDVTPWLRGVLVIAIILGAIACWFPRRFARS